MVKSISYWLWILKRIPLLKLSTFVRKFSDCALIYSHDEGISSIHFNTKYNHCLWGTADEVDTIVLILILKCRAHITTLIYTRFKSETWWIAIACFHYVYLVSSYKLFITWYMYSINPCFAILKIRCLPLSNHISEKSTKARYWCLWWLRSG